MLISIETLGTCDFPGGSGPPIPPLDPHIGRCLLLNFTLGRLGPSFKWGGGGGSRLDCQETALKMLFCLFSPQLILQFYSGLLMVSFKENYNFPRFQRGSSQNLFSINP